MSLEDVCQCVVEGSSALLGMRSGVVSRLVLGFEVAGGGGGFRFVLGYVFGDGFRGCFGGCPRKCFAFVLVVVAGQRTLGMFRGVWQMSLGNLRECIAGVFAGIGGVSGGCTSGVSSKGVLKGCVQGTCLKGFCGL